MVTARETTPTGLRATVVKVHEVRVGDRLYVTRSGAPSDVRMVVEIVPSAQGRGWRKPAEYRFDRGPALSAEELRRRDGTVLLLDPDAEVDELPDEFDLLPPLEQWIGLGGAIRVEHTPRQHEWSAQMLTEMHRANPRVDGYHCYAIDSRSLLIDQLDDGDFDALDPRPQLLVHARMLLLQPVAWHLIREALELEPIGSWRRAVDQVNDAAVELGVTFEDDPELAVVRQASLR